MAVDYKKVMLGTFSPQKESYVIELQEETTPSGFLARGNYTAKTKVLILEIYAELLAPEPITYSAVAAEPLL